MRENCNLKYGKNEWDGWTFVVTTFNGLGQSCRKYNLLDFLYYI